MNNIPGPYIVLAKAHLQNHDVDGALTDISKGDTIELKSKLYPLSFGFVGFDKSV